MTQFFEVPTKPAQAQRFQVQLGQQTYTLRVVWNTVSSCWVMDIADAEDVPIVQGIPLITGADLLEQYGYLGIPGRLIVQTDNDPNAVPTFLNLGEAGHLYYLVEDDAE